MTSKHLDASARLREQARRLLESKKVLATVELYGKLYFTGSYALDLMTWNDIDMQVVFNEGINPVEGLGKILLALADDADFVEGQLVHFRGDYKPKMPRGVYLGVKMHCNFSGNWKLDFWSLATADLEKNKVLIEALKAKLDPSSKQFILEIKHQLMQGSGRVPQMGSHFLYQGVLLEEIKERKAIFAYLRTHGITVDDSMG